MGSRRIALSRLTASQNRIIVLVQLLLFLMGVFLVVAGGLRIVIEFSEALFDVDSEQLKDGIADWVTGDTYTSPSVLLASIVAAIMGYSLLWSTMAVGSKEPPAWSAGRNSLILSVLALVALAGILIWINIPFLPFVLAGMLALAVLEIWLAVRWMQSDFRLVLGAERLHKQKRSGWLWVLYGFLVICASTVLALGVVYAVFTDIIELPISDAEPGELIYITTFDAFNDEWILSRDNSTTVEVLSEDDGNQYLVLFKEGVESATEIDDGEALFTLLDRTLYNFDLRVTTTQLASDVNHDNIFGVMFGYRSEDDPYFLFQVSGDGYYRLVKIVPGADNDEVISDWIDTTDIDVEIDESVENYPTLIRPGRNNSIRSEADTRNELRVVIRDQTFSFLVNGEALPLCLKGSRLRSMWVDGSCFEGNIQSYTYSDDAYRQGQVGFFISRTARSNPMADVSIAFDNVIIFGAPNNLNTILEQGAASAP